MILIYLWLSGTAWRLYKRFGSPTLALSCVSIVVILVNGIFQEEALFAPLAFGLVMAIVGLTFGSVDRLTRGGHARVRPAPGRPPFPLATASGPSR